MLKEVFLVVLVAIVAQCANVIPINRQGKNYPVPIIDPNKSSDDYFDDQYYPDIDDERIAEAPKDNQGRSGARPGKGGSRPSGGGSSRPNQGGTSRPGQARPRPAVGGTRPSQGSTRPGPGGTRQNQKAPNAIPINRQGKNYPVPIIDPNQSSDDYFDDQYYPDIDDEKIVEAPKDNQRKTAGSGARPGGSRPGKGGTRPAQGGTRPGQGKTRPDLSKYKNSPAKYIFKSPSFNEKGKTPTVDYFRTKKKEHVVTVGSPSDEFVLEILDGDPSGLGLRSETLGKESKLILSNPSGKPIVGRVKVYRDGYSG